MRRVKPAHLLRGIVYGGLGLALLVALQPQLALSRQAASGADAEQTTAELRALQQQVLRKYLSSLNEPLNAGVTEQVAGSSDALLLALMEWLPTAPAKRPAALLALPMSAPALQEALLKTSLVGRNAPPLAESVALLPRLDLAKESPVRLRLLQALAERAVQADDLPQALDLLANAARHPAATEEILQQGIELAMAARQTEAMVGLLEDWLKAPPAAATDSQVVDLRRQLAHLHLLNNEPRKAWTELEPLLVGEQEVLPAATLELVWTVATLTEHHREVVPHLERALSLHPQHQLHWRELSEATAPADEYPIQLARLAAACLAVPIEPRACEALFHLAWLQPERCIEHLGRALPMALRLDRMQELFDLIERVAARVSSDAGEQTHAAGSMRVALAAQCFQRGDFSSVLPLLELQLREQPEDLAAIRLRLQVQAQALPAMRAAQLWRRHLLEHPHDTRGHHQFVEAWLKAGQPLAAINHLIGCESQDLDAALRLRTAELALVNRHPTALQKALQRLKEAGEVPAADQDPALARAYADFCNQP